jgi:hypothetical protein
VNGGVAGNDVCVIFKTGHTVDIHWIDNHQSTNIDIGTVGGLIMTQKGPVIGVMNNYAVLNKGYTIHSPGQFEWCKNNINDKSINVPGDLQCIKTLDGYIIPLSIKVGLECLSIRTFTDHEFDNLPHVILTSGLDWDPSFLDQGFKKDEQWGDIPDLESSFDEFGDYDFEDNKKWGEVLIPELNKDFKWEEVPTPYSSFGKVPDDGSLCARMSGGESHIYTETPNHRSHIDKSKHADTPNVMHTECCHAHCCRHAH